MFLQGRTKIKKHRRTKRAFRSKHQPPKLEYLEARRVLATVTLNTDTGIAGELRDAIANAAPTETIDFNLSAGSETIVLDMNLGELVVDKALTIDGDNTAGSGIDVTISGGENIRVMNIDDGNGGTYAAVNLSNLTISDGVAYEGGGILNAEVLTLSNATVSGNSATAGSGGGINSVGYGSALNLLQGSTVDGNYASTPYTLAGGGVAVALGSLTIDNSTVSNNTATGPDGTYFGGGGIAVTSTGPAYQYYPINVTITNEAVISGNVIMGAQEKVEPYNGVNPYGGGLYSKGYGSVAIDSSTISGNTAVGTGANSANGGGLMFYSDYSYLYVDIDNTDIIGNSATNRGGGIGARTYYGTTGNVDMDITGSLIANNESVFYGGGIYQYGVNLRVNTTITQSTISGNTSGASAGISNWNAYLLLESSEVSGNSATNPEGFQYGGGISNYGLFLTYPGVTQPTLIVSNSTVSGNTTTGVGGGIYSFSGNLQIIQSTVSGNMAGSNGGGVFLTTFVYYNETYGTYTPYPGTTTIDRSTITLNSSDGTYGGGGIYAEYYHNTFSMSNTIVSGNLASVGSAEIYDYSSTGAISGNTTFSLIGYNSGTGFAEANPGPDGNGNIVGGPVGGAVDAMLGPLYGNGGPTMTHLPDMDSPAVDVADPSVLPGTDTDQRGFERVIDSDTAETLRMDMGSVEFGAAGVVPCDLDGDGDCDIDDIDMLIMTELDYDDNGSFERADIQAWLADAGAENPDVTGGCPYLEGDFNLDGFVDGQDFIIWNSNKFTSTGKYSLGDANGDGVTDGQDFIIWNNFKFQMSMDSCSLAAAGGQHEAANLDGGRAGRAVPVAPPLAIAESAVAPSANRVSLGAVSAKAAETPKLGSYVMQTMDAADRPQTADDAYAAIDKVFARLA